MAKTKKRSPENGIAVTGAYRLQIIDPDGTIAGEAEGKNLIVTQGLQNYLAVRLLAAGNSVGYMGIGTGATPVASTAGLPGEVANTARVAIGANSSTGSPGSSTVTAQVAATFSSGDANRTGNIGNIGLFGHSSATGSLFAGASFATSALNSSQAVNATYTVSFVAA